jgi:hypothetical protein
MPKLAWSGCRLVALAVLTASLAAGCGSSEPSPAVTSGGTASPSIVASGAPTSSSPDASEAAPTPAPSELPLVTEPPSESPAESEPPQSSTAPEPTDSSPPGPGAADACTVSNDANREFLVRVSQAVDWTALCAVLPKHWLLLNGSYHLAHGGEVIIDYGGPGGATLNLQQGGFCSDPGGCVPAGTDQGDAALGPLAGTLVALDDGGFAIVVDRAASPSWLMVVHGVDQATAVSLGAAMVPVAD